MEFILAYIIGSIPFGYLIARARGINIQKHGSGSIGATNVSRVLGGRWGKLCFLLDFSKGLMSIFFYQLYNPQGKLIHLLLIVVLLIIGHCFSVFLKFSGGKGVAVGAGALVMLTPISFITCLLFWLVIYKTTKIVAVASILTAVLLPCLSIVYSSCELELGADKFFGFYLFIAFFIIFTHRKNLRRLLDKEEFKFGDKK